MTQQTPENIPILGETGWFYTEFTGPGVAPTKEAPAGDTQQGGISARADVAKPEHHARHERGLRQC